MELSVTSVAFEAVGLIVAIIGGACWWTWWLCRDRHAADERLLLEIKAAYGSMRESADCCATTTANAAGVIGRVLERTLDRLDRCDEMLLTVHPNAVVERMHNKLVTVLGPVIAGSYSPPGAAPSPTVAAPPPVIPVVDPDGNDFEKMRDIGAP